MNQCNKEIQLVTSIVWFENGQWPTIIFQNKYLSFFEKAELIEQSTLKQSAILCQYQNPALQYCQTNNMNRLLRSVV